MSKLDALRRIKNMLDAETQAKRDRVREEDEDTEAAKLTLMLESNEAVATSITEAIRESALDPKTFTEALRAAVAGIVFPKPDAPVVSVTVPDVHVPKMEMPEIRLPDIHVPEPKVTVNVPEIRIPEIKLPHITVPKTEVHFPDRMDVGLGDFSPTRPLYVLPVDPKGNYVQPTTGGGGARRVKIDNDDSEPIPISGTISATFSADFGSGEVGSQTLRTVQATNAVSSVYVTGANGTIGVVTINPDGLPVYGGAGSASSVSVTDIFGTTGTNVVNPDGRIKVELPTGSSGLTDTELRATSVPVEQVSGSIWSTAIIGTVPVSGTFFQSTQPVSVASTLDVQQVSGAAWTVSTVPMNAFGADGLTNEVIRSGTGFFNGSTWDRARNTSGEGNALRVQMATDAVASIYVTGGNTLDVKQVSGASDSVSVLSMPAVTVTSITNTTATNIVDSTGVAYSGSNPVPTKEVRASTGTNTSVADNAASVTILASNTARLGATVYNDSSATLYLLLGATAASTTNYTCRIASMGYYEVPFGYTGQLTGIWATDPGDGAARVTEIT